jgi:N utilization substance protein B
LGESSDDGSRKTGDGGSRAPGRRDDVRRSASRARQRSRELLVKALYQTQLAGHGFAELTAQYESDPGFEKADRLYFRELLGAVLAETEVLDGLIARQAVRSIEQLDAVGRAILWLGIMELKARADVPTKVVINEAVTLAKRYGATDSFRFVNAVLDKTAREIRNGSADAL